MSTIVLRSVKGTPLTNTEVDNNFNNLNTDKVEKTAAAITGGTINGTSVGATTPTTGAFTTIAASGTTTLSGNQIISVTDNTNAALRITQLGTGNAILVEDATNPDSTPFVIDAVGATILGYTTTVATQGASGGSLANTQLQLHGNAASTSTNAIFNWNSSATSFAGLVFNKSISNVVGTRGALTAANTDLGALSFNGDDGTNFIPAASIFGEVDGTPGTNDMPGRLVFSTTADGASTPTERVRITSAGKTGFATAAPAATVHVAGDTILSNVNVLGASYDSVSFSVAGQETSATDLFFSPNGLKMYVTGSNSDNVNEYNLSTAWVVSSAVFATSFSVNAQDTSPQGLFFRADGTKMYVLGSTNDTVFQYTLSTPWSVATASYDSISFSVAGQETTPTGIFFKPNGLTMYIVGSTGDAVYQYTLSTAWNVSTATFFQSFSVSGQESLPTGLSFTGDGSRMFVMGTTGDDVNVYNLTTPWDISTSAFVNVFSVSGQDTSPQGIYIKPDGTKMYILGSTNDTVFQYTVPSIDIQLTGPTSVAALEVQQDLTVYGNTTGSFLNNGFRENISGQYYNLVSQADIGTAPNEIPLNQYLGLLAYEDTETPALNVGTGITTGTGTICKANGGLMGGIYTMSILIDLTGLNSGGTAGDIIGVNGTALPCYIAQLPAMTVLGGRMTCLETPAGGDTDIDLYSATEGTGVEDSAITALTETEIINAGAQTRGTLTYFSADPATNAYFYLVGQGTANATYTAGRFLIEIFGVQ
jgi:sugar lactone lactonase YvrE